MVKQIVKKKYYRILFTLTAPLAVGSGENAYTDKDIIRDSRGIPYIPASAIAGVGRSAFLKNGELKPEAKAYFGHVSINKASNNKKQEQIESALVFYDAVMLSKDEKKYHTSVRDSVKLDDFKTAVDGAKFDMEILEPGVCFCTYLEQNFYKGADEDYGKQIICWLNSEEAVFGGKNSRGYGAFEIKAEELREAEFDLGDSSAVESWLKFDLYDEDSKDWKACKETMLQVKTERVLRLQLKQRGGISIRKYTTEVQPEKTMPDFMQLTVHGSDKEPVPVIPGTSWAGAIRHRMKVLGLPEDADSRLFGYVKEKEKKKAKSLIRFSESQITGGNFKVLSRNAIDRFSGGTVDGALFTEKTYYGGTTELCISLQPDKIMKPAEQKILAAALADLHYGFLAVGGETSIGRGLFEISGINGIPLGNTSEDAIYDILLEQIGKLWSTTEEVSA